MEKNYYLLTDLTHVHPPERNKVGSEEEENFIALHANTSEILISALSFEEDKIN